MTDEGSTARPADSERTRVRWNLALFTLVAVLATLWFERHLKGYLTESLLLGGTLSLLGLWKLAWDMLAAGGGPQTGDVVKRALGSPHAREYLVFALGLVVVLWAATSSIYLTYSGGKDAAAAYTVEVWQCDKPASATDRSCTTMLEAPVELKQYDRERGRPWFFRVATQHLEYRIASSPTYEPLALDWSPWAQHRLDVPGDFKQKDLHLLRLYAGYPLIGELPESSRAPGLRYRLEIDDGRSVLGVEPLTKAAVLTGMPATSLEAAVKAARPLHDVVEAYFTQQGAPVADREPLVAAIVNDALRHPSAEWRAGTTLKIRVLQLGDTPESTTTKFAMAYSIPAHEGHVHDVVLASE